MINLNNIVTFIAKNTVISRAINALLILEPLLLAFMVYAFWYPIEKRYAYLGLLIFVPVFMFLRLVSYGRLFTRFPLDVWFVAFIVLGVLNLYVSPFTWANPMSRLYMLGRPALGMALCVYFVEYVRLYRRIKGLLLATLLLGLVIGGMALLSSNWDNKGDQLAIMRDLLPRYAYFPGAEGGFNVNEIAGGLTWIVPLCAGLMFWRGKSNFDKLLRWGFIAAFIASFAALYFGQSRFAIVGVLITLVPMIYFLFARWRWRFAASVVVIFLGVLELMIVRNVFTPPGQAVLAQRDEESVSIRFDIWESALKIVEDHPFTGVGMNMFREKPVRTQYPVPAFNQPVLPHAHNEFLQIATDLGLPGFALLFTWYGVAFYGLVRTYRNGSSNLKLMAIAVAGGLLAHILFSLGDAVALWDRLAFILWWLLALASAAYWFVDNNLDRELPNQV
ncbi:MAG: hypothetical protein GC179_09520 [Anaerolineaceae bacterium]|nr:hypothetical protein [Anaerolineaceae bacterium]